MTKESCGDSLLPLDAHDDVDEGARRHCEHEDESDLVEGQRATEGSTEEQDQSENRDRCEDGAHAGREDRAVPEPDVADHVAQSKAGGHDEHD